MSDLLDQVPGSNTPPGEREFAEVDGLRILVDEAKYSAIIVRTIRSGGYERHERNALSAILKPNDRVLEIGGAIGVVGLCAARIVGAANVISFEANADLVADAQINYATNGLPVATRTAVLRNAKNWGGPGETAMLHVNADFWSSSLANRKGTIRLIEVPTACFELESRNFNANVLLCDIEGGEVDLLLDADLTGYTDIVVELHMWAGRERMNTLVRRLILDGYSINFHLSAGGVVCFHAGLAPRP